MKFISAQPDSDYYVWQLEVQMHNFAHHGIEQDAIILFGFDKEPNMNALKFARRTKARVEFIPDRRTNRNYIPSIRPHILKKFFAADNNIDRFMYHDADIIFLEKPDFGKLPDVGVVLSDSGIRSYLDSKYIISKSESLFENMCYAVGIDPITVIDNDSVVGGAQYIFNFIPMAFFWNKVERDSNSLYQLMTTGEYLHRQKGHPIQAWTADMWAVLWNIWLYNEKTSISDELDFCWPTQTLEYRKKIFHNSGVTPERADLFYKQDYSHKSPFGANFESIDPRFCSSLYVQEIIQTGANLRQ